MIVIQNLIDMMRYPSFVVLYLVHLTRMLKYLLLVYLFGASVKFHFLYLDYIIEFIGFSFFSLRKKVLAVLAWHLLILILTTF